MQKKLSDFTPQNCRDLHAINHSEYLAIVSHPITAESHEFVIYKYSLRNDQWSEEVMTDKLLQYKGSVYDTKKQMLYVMAANKVYMAASKVYAIDMRNWRISHRFNMTFGSVTTMLLIDNELHIFGEETHLVISISRSWKIIKYDFDYRTQVQNGIIHKVMFSKLRNSLIAFQQCHDDPDYSRLLEYSLETKEWSVLGWSVTSWECPNRYGPREMLMAEDGRYLLCFGGAMLLNLSSDTLIFYDLKEQRKRWGHMQPPRIAGYRGVLLGSEQGDELIVSGFVKRTYKKAEFRNVQALPLHLIRLLSKWYRNEQICLIKRHRTQSNHRGVNVDDIISG